MVRITLAWLFWWMFRVRERLRKSVERRVRVWQREGKPITVEQVSRDLYPLVRTAGYMQWLGQALWQFDNVGTGAFIASMPGISPDSVREVVRREARINPHGAITGGAQDVAERLTAGFHTLTAQACRESAREMVGEYPERVYASLRDQVRRGHPVTRFITMAEDPSTQVGHVVAQEKSFAQLLDEAQETIDKIFADTRHSAHEELAQNLARVSEQFGMTRKSRAQQHREDREAEEAFARENAQEVHREARRSYLEAVDYLRGNQPGGGQWPIGWARIPVGAYTCPFCLMLASRGPVYRKDAVLIPARLKRHADKHGMAHEVKIGAYGQEAYHWGCDCVAVPVSSHSSPEVIDAIDGAMRLWQEFAQAGNPSSLKAWRRWIESDDGLARAKALIRDFNPAHS